MKPSSAFLIDLVGLSVFLLVLLLLLVTVRVTTTQQCFAIASLFFACGAWFSSLLVTVFGEQGWPSEVPFAATVGCLLMAAAFSIGALLAAVL